MKQIENTINFGYHCRCPACPPALAQDTFVITRLDENIPLLWYSLPSDLNESGQAAFYCYVESQIPVRSYVWISDSIEGRIRILGASSDNSIIANSISDNGTVVGGWYPGAWAGDALAFTWNVGTKSMSFLPLLTQTTTTSQNPLGNSNGYVVGKSTVLVNNNQSQRAFRWTAATDSIVELVNSNCARQVNSSGAACGEFYEDNVLKACWWDANGDRTAIPLPSGYNTSTTKGINDDNLVIGTAKNTTTNAEVNWSWAQPSNSLTTFSTSEYGTLLGVNNNGDLLFGTKIRRQNGSTVSWPSTTGDPNNVQETDLKDIAVPVAVNNNLQVLLQGKLKLAPGNQHALLASPWWNSTKTIPISIRLGNSAGQGVPSEWIATNRNVKIRFDIRYGKMIMETPGESQNVNYYQHQFDGTEYHTFYVPTHLRGNVSVRVTVASNGNSPEPTAHWLHKTINLIVPESGTINAMNLTLINGDVDENNVINTDDYLVLSDAFDTTSSDENWDARADLDGNNSINTDDYLILSNNFDIYGDD